ncbi:MAG: gamma carbonic anhydrase family protein [Proteobacteria bacterium]|nr:MAG: gamma carbonic anhydrase family protein [Pseudomonadota bacterium]TDJ68954.1 MAG: gamma carbonic anhydrase family protein [Pseudomonadota bacterium]
MAIRKFGDTEPRIHQSALIDPTAVVIGHVEIGEEVFVLPYVVIRGDVNTIKIGPHTNIQDGSILHVNSDSVIAPGGAPLHIGAQVTIGHKVLLHGCRIGDHCLIGMGSTVMDNVVIENDVIVGAGSLVTSGKHLASGYLYTGAPARKVRQLTDEEAGYIEYSYRHYLELKELHRGSQL